jgi:hypothetical protein
MRMAAVSRFLQGKRRGPDRASPGPSSECSYQAGNGNPLFQRGLTMISTILLVVLILLLIGALPTWGHSRSWGFYPSGGLGLLVLILLILLLTGRI